MNTPLSITASALLAVALNAACVGEASAQAFADSTGGSSQIHGELVTTPAGIVPLASSSHPTRTSLGVEPSGDEMLQHYADSTGGSSAAHAAFLLEHAQVHPESADQVLARARFQPYVDSTGGSSAASAERVFEAAADVAPARGIGVASAQPQEHAAR
jgi:hypothetical protein